MAAIHPDSHLHPLFRQRSPQSPGALEKISRASARRCVNERRHGVTGDLNTFRVALEIDLGRVAAVEEHGIAAFETAVFLAAPSDAGDLVHVELARRGEEEEIAAFRDADPGSLRG